MKKLFLIVLLTLSLSASFAQQGKTAWIFDQQVGITSNETRLSEILSDIKQHPEISTIVFTGNLTTKSSAGEFQKLKSFTNNLSQTCYFIPGINDYKWIQGDASVFKDVFSDDKFYYKTENYSVIGFTSAIERRGEGGHFKREDLEWLNSLKDSLTNNEPVILLLYQPMNSSVDNWFQATNMMSGKNVVAFFSTEGEMNKRFDVAGIPSFSAKGITAKNKDWSYFLFDSTDDSLIVSEVTKSGKVNSTVKLPLRNPYEIIYTDSTQIIDYEKSLILQYDVKSSLDISPVVTKDFIYTITSNGTVICLDKNGSEKWQTEIEGKVIGSIIKDGDLIVAGTLQGDLISINANNGDIFQTIGVGEPITSLLTISIIEYPEGKVRSVVLGTLNGNLYCYNIYSFELIWQNSSANGMIESKPLVVNDRIIFGSWDTNLYCVDKRTGILNWKWNNGNSLYFAPGRCSPVSDGKNIFLTTPDKNVYAIDILLGATNWKKEFGGWESIGISTDKQKLFIKSFKDKINIISATDGKLIKEIDLKSGFDTNPVEIIEWNGNIILPQKHGNIISLGSDYSVRKILFAGTSRLNTVKHFYDNVFITSNTDGKIFCFRLN